MMKKIFFIKLFLISIFFSCKKISDQPALPVPAPILIPVPVNDGIDFPVTKGSFYNYLRYDTTAVTNAVTTYYTDSSHETITNMGKVVMPDLGITDSVLFLQINNNTKHILDTIYFLYNDTTFAIFGRQEYRYNRAFYMTPSDTIGNVNTIYSYKTWYKYLKITLPVKGSSFNLSTLEYMNAYIDTAFIKIDTTVNILNTKYPGSVYILRDSYYYSFAPSGVGGYKTSFNIIVNPNIGMIYLKQQPYFYQGSSFDNILLSKWFTRKLIDFKIQ